MIGGGRSELAVTRRIWLESKAFNTMSSMLRSKRYTWNIKEQIYGTCVRPVMTYGSETCVREYFEKNRKTDALNDVCCAAT